MIGLGAAALFLIAAAMTGSKIWALVFLSLCYGGITLQQPGVLGICLDIGGRYAGAVTGAMNMATFAAAFFSSVAYGYIVKSYGYDAPFLPMILLLVLGALLWLKIDATREVIADTVQAEALQV